jgi:flagella basal body P-ring formation protein FlgA
MNRLLSILLLLLLAFPAIGRADAGLLEAEVARQMKAAMPWQGADIEVDDIDLRGYHSKPVDFDHVVVRLPDGMRHTGKISASVALISGTREVGRFWTSAKVKLYREAVVALMPLRRNREIVRGDVRLERVEVKGSANVATSIEDVLGMTAVRPINPGMIVKMSYLRPKTLVRRGDSVTLRIENDKLLIKAKAIATEDGARGATITVRSQSGKEIQGKVVGPGEVTVAF